MTKMEKMERAIAIVNATEVEDKAEIVEMLQHEIEMAKARKDKAADRKSKKAKENEPLMDAVFAVLAGEGGEDGMRAKEIFEVGIAGVGSVQKVSSLLKALIEAGRAEKEVVKGNTIFKAIV